MNTDQAEREHLLHSEITEKIIGVFYDVYNELGGGFLESVAARAIERVHEAQLLHYLRATTIEVGLVLNFGHRAEFRRLRMDNETKAKKRIRENPCESVARGVGL